MFAFIDNRFAAAHSAGGRGGWGQFVAAFGLALRTHATRQALPELPDHLLADIGIERADALAEAARLPWDTAAFHQKRDAGGLWPALRQRVEDVRKREIVVSAAPNQVSWGG